MFFASAICPQREPENGRSKENKVGFAPAFRLCRTEAPAHGRSASVRLSGRRYRAKGAGGSVGVFGSAGRIGGRDFGMRRLARRQKENAGAPGKTACLFAWSAAAFCAGSFTHPPHCAPTKTEQRRIKENSSSSSRVCQLCVKPSSPLLWTCFAAFRAPWKRA